MDKTCCTYGIGAGRCMRKVQRVWLVFPKFRTLNRYIQPRYNNHNTHIVVHFMSLLKYVKLLPTVPIVYFSHIAK